MRGRCHVAVISSRRFAPTHRERHVRRGTIGHGRPCRRRPLSSSPQTLWHTRAQHCAARRGRRRAARGGSVGRASQHHVEVRSAPRRSRRRRGTRRPHPAGCHRRAARRTAQLRGRRAPESHVGEDDVYHRRWAPLGTTRACCNCVPPRGEPSARAARRTSVQFLARWRATGAHLGRDDGLPSPPHVPAPWCGAAATGAWWRWRRRRRAAASRRRRPRGRASRSRARAAGADRHSTRWATRTASACASSETKPASAAPVAARAGGSTQFESAAALSEAACRVGRRRHLTEPAPFWSGLHIFLNEA